MRPPAAAFFASSDRKGERPLTHLAAFSGVLQADGYDSFNVLYEGQRPGRARIVAACGAHTRRKFFDVHASTASAVAFEALKRIGAIYEVERSVSGKPPNKRLWGRRHPLHRCHPSHLQLAKETTELVAALLLIRTRTLTKIAPLKSIER